MPKNEKAFCTALISWRASIRGKYNFLSYLWIDGRQQFGAHSMTRQHNGGSGENWRHDYCCDGSKGKDRQGHKIMKESFSTRWVQQVSWNYLSIGSLTYAFALWRKSWSVFLTSITCCSDTESWKHSRMNFVAHCDAWDEYIALLHDIVGLKYSL